MNVVWIRPPGYVHAYALAELVEYLVAELGAALAINAIDPDAQNIVVGAHLLGDAVLPASTVIFNSEPLGGHAWPGYPALLARHRVWDYAIANRVHVPHDRFDVLPFAYCEALRRTQLVHRPGDALLFYGVITPYRRAILDGLRARGVAIDTVTGEYGTGRDVRMMRARAVLNLHKTEDRSVFEPVRCFYPLINGVPVISEPTTDPSAEPFREAMVFTDDLAGAVPIDPAPFRRTAASTQVLRNVALVTRGTV